VTLTVTFDPWRILRTLLGLVCCALVTSIGGAGIVAAPVTLPLLWVAGRYAKPLGRAALNVVAVITAAELGWALAYAAVGEQSPLIWALPLALAVAVFAGYPLTQRAVQARATARKSAGRFVTGTA
jgi:hypothetical protein